MAQERKGGQERVRPERPEQERSPREGETGGGTRQGDVGQDETENPRRHERQRS